ncbi:MAG TPA: hypothetical protein VK629_12035 [Steroidobacteraceae bacterium]|nr:hypothetical protein [Steroidobacteraceae bacterium]
MDELPRSPHWHPEIGMVEQGKLTNAQVATVLRESIDDLKLTIDSLEPMGGIF